MTKVADIVDAVERTIPLSAQEGWDNCGLIVGDAMADIESVLICVDVTGEVMDEAERLGAGMVLSHHPVIFHPLKRLVSSTYAERVVERAVRAGVAIYAAHTNLDSVPGGLSHRLAEMLGLRDTVLLSPRDGDPSTGFGVVGECEPSGTMEYLVKVKELLKLEMLRHSAITRGEVRRVAVCSGSGGALAGAAKKAGADLYIAADFRYNDFLDADRELVIADAGHFETEYCAIDALYDIITKKIPTFAVHKSKSSRNPVRYL